MRVHKKKLVLSLLFSVILSSIDARNYWSWMVPPIRDFTIQSPK